MAKSCPRTALSVLSALHRRPLSPSMPIAHQAPAVTGYQVSSSILHPLQGNSLSPDAMPCLGCRLQQALVAPASLSPLNKAVISGGFVPDGSGLLSITEACLAAFCAQNVPVQEVSVISYSSAISFLMCESASTQFEPPGTPAGVRLPVLRLLRYLWASAVHVFAFCGGEGSLG